MALAFAVAIGSVALGAMLGLYRRAGPLLGGVRTFALVSAVVVVVTQLLPEALEGLGLWAMLVTAASGLLPTLLGRLLGESGHGHGHGEGDEEHHGRGHRLGLEVGYLGLVVHKIGDGAGIASFTSVLHEGHGHYDILVAIAAHTVPVTALVVLAFAHTSGVRSGIYRAVGLAAATALGVGAVQVLPLSLLEASHPWVSAVVGGLLLHVVAHDWTPGAKSDRRGPIEILAIALGLVILVLPADAHVHGDGVMSIADRASHAFVDLTFDTAPTLLIGLLIGAALQLLGGRISMRWLTRGSNLRQALRGAIVGAPLPICACGVLPVAQSLRMRGGSAALVVAFLLATPELGVETFALTVKFLGWEMAFVRLIAAVVVAIVAALVVARVVGQQKLVRVVQRPSTTPVAAEHEAGSWPKRVLHQLDELLEHVGPWTLVGLVAAAYVEATLSPESLTGMTFFGLDVLVVSLVAVPSYVCAASATPLAAVLLAKGMSPGAVLAGLLLGPATNLATVGFLRSHFGSRATAIGLAGLVATVWLVAVGLNASPIDITAELGAAEAHEAGWVAWSATAVLVALSLRAIWREGLASWLSALREGLGDPSEEHGHGHGHG